MYGCIEIKYIWVKKGKVIQVDNVLFDTFYKTYELIESPC